MDVITLTVIVGPHPQARAFADYLLGEIEYRVMNESSDEWQGIPVAFGPTSRAVVSGVSLLAALATSLRGQLDQDLGFEQALVLENTAIDCALVLEGEQREAFINAAIGDHWRCSSRWRELNEPDNDCGDTHLGPILPTGDHDVIDHGVAIWLKCEQCDQLFTASIDIDEMEEMND